ncbi:unnamed protein product [Cuscuta campestris]|uniref:RING-CH-type domain-containing protein n=2 Tax=Cuscuta sect. Cleistogrammica TaxID=1824901 RepID=A0A484MHM9_9ASTE|nr:hypothetical protein DM860_001999 [Cuscuta australis]VFQ88493.1 unnamed protein product [Cuscuta campestris]
MEADRKMSSGAAETIIAMRLEGNGSENSVAGEVAAKAPEEDRFSCSVIDVDRGGDEETRTACCRICQLSERDDSNQKNLRDLIELGCGCKGDLRFSHLRCAEAWFLLRGNRFCEICGEIAKNVTRVGSGSFMEEWSGGRSSGERPGDCRERQPFCNFLMGCLVLAFVLPWFFRLNF